MPANQNRNWTYDDAFALREGRRRLSRRDRWIVFPGDAPAVRRTVDPRPRRRRGSAPRGVAIPQTESDRQTDAFRSSTLFSCSHGR